jgi:transcriptional regulator with XRE-family HTH domain
MLHDDSDLQSIAKDDADFVTDVAGRDIHNAAKLSTDIDHLVGANIKRERIRAGLTQVELGARIGVSGSMIAQYESSAAYARRPRWETLERIARALGISSVRLVAVPAEQSYWTDRFRNGLAAALEGVDPADAEAAGFDLAYAESIASEGAGFTFEDACQLCCELGYSPDDLLKWKEAHGSDQDKGDYDAINQEENQ